MSPGHSQSDPNSHLTRSSKKGTRVQSAKSWGQDDQKTSALAIADALEVTVSTLPAFFLGLTLVPWEARIPPVRGTRERIITHLLEGWQASEDMPEARASA